MKLGGGCHTAFSVATVITLTWGAATSRMGFGCGLKVFSTASRATM